MSGIEGLADGRNGLRRGLCWKGIGCEACKWVSAHWARSQVRRRADGEVYLAHWREKWKT